MDTHVLSSEVCREPLGHLRRLRQEAITAEVVELAAGLRSLNFPG